MDTTKAAYHLTRLPGEILAIRLMGKWQLGHDVPETENVQEQLHVHPPIRSNTWANAMNTTAPIPRA